MRNMDLHKIERGFWYFSPRNIFRLEYLIIDMDQILFGTVIMNIQYKACLFLLSRSIRQNLAHKISCFNSFRWYHSEYTSDSHTFMNILIAFLMAYKFNEKIVTASTRFIALNSICVFRWHLSKLKKKFNHKTLLHKKLI